MGAREPGKECPREAGRRAPESRPKAGEGLWEKRNVQGKFGEVAANSLFGCSCDTLRKTYSPYRCVRARGCFQGARGRGASAPLQAWLHMLSASHVFPTMLLRAPHTWKRFSIICGKEEEGREGGEEGGRQGGRNGPLSAVGGSRVAQLWSFLLV